MKYYHEQDLEKSESLTPSWMCGAYINGDFIKIADIDDDVLETIKDELVEGWFFTVDDEPYATPYGPCEYDKERKVYINSDGFEIRNEYYKEN